MRSASGEAHRTNAAGNEAAALFQRVRAQSERLAASLSPEDQLAQSMPDASPTKWHLAHTSWFFETFLLEPVGVAPYDPAFGFLFNSYYEALGSRHPRPQRGLITRPSSAEVSGYRAHVTAAMTAVLERGDADVPALDLLELGLAHEEQHQELILTDILHLLSQNPLKPAYRRPAPRIVDPPVTRPLAYVEVAGGVYEIGWRGEGFAFDNEGPAHQVLVRPFSLADRVATNRDWLAFMDDDGYRRHDLWLSDGWAQVRAEDWAAPMYWSAPSSADTTRADQGWRMFTLEGLQPLELDAPVTHISYYEAAAFAHWSGARLPTEAEWEITATDLPVRGGFVESGRLSPSVAGDQPGLRQMFGDVWEWTASAYSPYPGFRPDVGAVGEYNGKFMINQMVLRGGSCATSQRHVRASYRNFFQPHQRWQFSGVRLARDVG